MVAYQRKTFLGFFQGNLGNSTNGATHQPIDVVGQ